MEVEDLSEEVFYIGSVSTEYELDIYGASDLKESDINVVIDDPTVIEISFEKKYEYIDDICFTINSLKEGTTSFYFETSDKIIQSEPVNITTVNNIISLSFSNTDDIVLSSWKTEHKLYFDIETYEDLEKPVDYLKFISENEDIVKIDYNDNSYLESCTIKRINPGQTNVYIQTLDGKIQSEKIRVIVEEDPTEAPTEKEIEYEVEVDNSRTVYITPYGEKYHYSADCAGNNASSTTEDSVKNFYEPCQKCAQ